MTIRERIEAFWAGERPDTIPYTIYQNEWRHTKDDQPIAEARATWPEKLFWCNIRVGDYGLPPQELREKVLGLVEEGSVDGRLFAFEVSEQYPDNWRESMPVVLEALEETANYGAVGVSNRKEYLRGNVK